MSRSQSILAAFRREVERHAALLDAGGDIHSVTVTLKLAVGTDQIRSISWQEDRLATPYRGPDVKKVYASDKTGV